MVVKARVVGGGFLGEHGAMIPVIADRGDRGMSAYQVWLAAGNVGTEQDYQSSLRGGQGDEGWSPVLAGEADGSRTLIKVADWTGGTGVKPAAGMYIGTTGYVATKAQAFNFNAAKRVMAFSGGPTNAQGVAQISFAAAGFTNLPAVVPLPATTPVLAGNSSTVISNITKDGCTATVRQAALLSGLTSLLLGATANVLAIEQ